MPIQFSVDDSWHADDIERSDLISLSRGPGPQDFPHVTLQVVTHTLRPDRLFRTGAEILGSDTVSPVPLDIIAWFKMHPRLEVLSDMDVLIDEFPAKRLDVRAVSGYKSTACPESSCVLLFRLASTENEYRVFKIDTGDLVRIYLVIRGSQLFAMSVVAPMANFEQYARLAESVFQTVRFRS